jgi:hypothetical protein
MKMLHEKCRAATKIWKEFPEGSHNDTVAEEGYFEAINDFVNDHVIKVEKRDSISRTVSPDV